MSATRALIVDDNPKNVFVLARLLSEQEVSSTEVTNPRLLESVLEGEEAPDIAFVDLEMPGVDGYDVLETLRARAGFQGVPIVAHTVHVSEINIAFQRGFDGFIAKPLDPDRFPGQLERILRGEPVWESA